MTLDPSKYQLLILEMQTTAGSDASVRPELGSCGNSQNPVSRAFQALIWSGHVVPGLRHPLAVARLLLRKPEQNSQWRIERVVRGRKTWTKAVSQLNRRQLLASSAIVILLSSPAVRAAIIRGGLPWKPGAADPPALVTPTGWHFFTLQEAAIVEAFVDRLIPADDLSPGGKDCGCAVYIDRQLAGPYGRFDGYYMSGPFLKGTKQQGPQSAVTPAQHYRKALAAFDKACSDKLGGKVFTALSDAQRDEAIKGLGRRFAKARRHRQQRVFQAHSERHPEWLFGGSNLWRQPKHGVMEDDRFSRHPLRLSGLGRPP